MNRRKNKFKKRRLVDMTKMLMMTCLPRSSSRNVACHIRQLKCRQQNNPIKSFYETGKPPITLHIVQFVKPGVKLFEQPQDLLPEIWKNYLANDYQRSLLTKVNESAESKPTFNAGSNGTSKKPNHCFEKKNSFKLNGQFKSVNVENKEKEKLSLHDKRLLTDSDDITTEICNSKKTKSKSSLLEERNVIRCKISRFPKVGTGKRTSNCNLQETTPSDNRPHCDDIGVRNIKEKDTKESKETKFHNEYKIKQNKMKVSELFNDKVDTHKDDSNSLCVPNCGQSTDGLKKTVFSNNSCNGEFKAITKANVSSKPTENCVLLNSVKLKLPSRSVSHKPRPPSTVKLKETANLTSKFNLYGARFKVPTSFSRSQKTPKS